MRLRHASFIFLLIFGLVPILTSVMINMPMVFEQLSLFYHKAHLQNLRADFRDLDQHLASRRETLRFLAKLPEPGFMASGGRMRKDELYELQRIQYNLWLNHLLLDQEDIIELHFVNDRGEQTLLMGRKGEVGMFEEVTSRSPYTPADFVRATLGLEDGEVITSPIHFHDHLAAEDGLMLLSVASPVVELKRHSSGVYELITRGAVIANIDVGGLARAYPNTLWVHQDGSYAVPNRTSYNTFAFDEFPGLAELFAKRELALWEGSGQRNPIIWVPMFVENKGDLLWVGRSVDPSPLNAFRDSLQSRIFGVVLTVLVILLLVARFISRRLEQIGEELVSKLGRVIEAGEAVPFRWRGPRELRELGDKLTVVAAAHAEDRQIMLSHARALEESNRYKSQFLANISHELRTPLNSILLLSRMLANDHQGVGSTQRERAEVIHRASRDLAALINNLLDIGRIEARRIDLQPKQVVVRSCLDETVSVIAPQFEQKGLRLTLLLDDDLPTTIIVDDERLRQIVINFLSNALKFTNHGEVTLSCRRDNRCGDGGIAIAVEDSGIGIPPAEQARIFDLFHQVDGTTRRRHEGSGLGLSISRELAHLMGGAIEVESREGVGSTFTLYLPAAQRAEGDATHIITSVSCSRAEGVDAEGAIEKLSGRVLLVTPCFDLVVGLTPALRQLGLMPLVAADLLEAKALLSEEGPFDLIILSGEENSIPDEQWPPRLFIGKGEGMINWPLPLRSLAGIIAASLQPK
jgi:signal transduction histidine kinase